jgi:ABC-2 type transport system permease protein
VLIGVAFDADLSGVKLGTVLPFLPALVLAMVLRFAVEWCLALSAFWLTKVTAINSLFFALTTFFGGIFAPLAVLPGWMQTVAVWTPFPWSLAFPVEVFLGRRTGTAIWLGYAAQLGWIVLALGGLALLWRRATRRYSAVGA